MRGCLVTLVILVAIGLTAIWFLSAPVLGLLVEAGLASAGVQGRTTVDVRQDSPLDILALRADEVRIRSSDASWQGLHAANVDLDLSDVGIVGWSIASIEGTLSNVALPGPAGTTLAVPRVDVTGDSGDVRATITISAKEVERAIDSAVTAGTGLEPSAVRLAAPDLLSLTIGGVTVSGRLKLEAGSLVFELPPSFRSGSMALIGGPADIPYEITWFAVRDGALDLVVRLNGLIDR